MIRPLRLDSDRFFPMYDRARDLARALFAEVEHLSIISPHGHTDSARFATDAAFSDAPSLLVQPDHYLLRMLYSQGVPLEGLGINPLDGAPNPATPREIWRLFAAHYRLFRGTPSRAWLDHAFATIFDLKVRLEPKTADHYFDAIGEALIRPELRPRALFERFGLEVLATTDGALIVLDYHRAIHASGWSGQVIPTFRPDDVTDPDRKDFAINVELRSAKPTYRIVGSLRRVVVASADPADARGVLADPAVHVAILTVTEPTYGLGPDGELDIRRPDVTHDLANLENPVSGPGWLFAALVRRRAAGAGPISILICDDLRENSARLGQSLRTMAARLDPELAAWIFGEVGFPNTMIDAVTPASDAALRTRVAAAKALDDEAVVQREPFAAWAMEDGFAAPRPAWERLGVEILADIAGHELSKLHVLNTAHSALAYLGLPRRQCFVQEAIADAELCGFLDAMIAGEIASSLPGQDVATYCRATRRRFFEPAIDHRLDQIARDGASKLRGRIHPRIIANAHATRRGWAPSCGLGSRRSTTPWKRRSTIRRCLPSRFAANRRSAPRSWR